MRKESRDNDKVAKKRFNSQDIPWWLWLLKHVCKIDRQDEPYKKKEEEKRNGDVLMPYTPHFKTESSNRNGRNDCRRDVLS